MAASSSPVAVIKLPDAYGELHDVRIDADEWERAVALTPEWRIIDHYGSPKVIAAVTAAILHPQRSRDLSLALASFIMKPRFGETVRHLDRDPLNLTRENLVNRPKHAPTIARPPKPSAKQLELEAIVAERFQGAEAARALRAEAAVLRAGGFR